MKENDADIDIKTYNMQLDVMKELVNDYTI